MSNTASKLEEIKKTKRQNRHQISDAGGVANKLGFRVLTMSSRCRSTFQPWKEEEEFVRVQTNLYIQFRTIITSRP